MTNVKLSGVALHKFRMAGNYTGFGTFGTGTGGPAQYPAQYPVSYPAQYPAQYPPNDLEAAEKARTQASVTHQQVELNHMG